MTKEERRARRAAKKAARHEKWGGPRPPWLAEAGAVLKTLAIEAVKWAAAEVLAGGQAKHRAAVGRVMAHSGLKGRVGDLAEGLVAEAVWKAYEELADNGEIE